MNSSFLALIYVQNWDPLEINKENVLASYCGGKISKINYVEEERFLIGLWFWRFSPRSPASVASRHLIMTWEWNGAKRLLLCEQEGEWREEEGRGRRGRRQEERRRKDRGDQDLAMNKLQLHFPKDILLPHTIQLPPTRHTLQNVYNTLIVPWPGEQIFNTSTLKRHTIQSLTEKASVQPVLSGDWDHWLEDTK